MNKLHFPYVNLPLEFITLLKINLPATTAPGPVFDVIRPNRALYSILENAFKEFDDGRGVEKVMTALGWSNFRERMASIYVYKMMYGDYPSRTNMELVEDIHELETRFSAHSVNSFSRLFMLGFYLKMANLHIQQREDNQFLEIKIPYEISTILKLSQGRSEKIDWLILIVVHLNAALGDKMLINNLAAGKKFEDLYEMMSRDSQELMSHNLLAYGSSIQEPDVFLYEKV